MVRGEKPINAAHEARERRDKDWKLLSREVHKHHSSSSRRQAGIIAGIVGGIIIILIILIFFVYRSRKKRVEEKNPPAAEVPLRTRLGESMYEEPQNVMPLYGDEGSMKGEAAVIHKGEAGWSYMSYVSRQDPT